jgi:hypothetical protein
MGVALQRLLSLELSGIMLSFRSRAWHELEIQGSSP